MDKVGIIGSGLMGSGIAFVVVRHLDVEAVVVDVADGALQKSSQTVERLAARAVQKGEATEDEAAAWIKRLRYTTDQAEVAGAGFIIEAVLEDLDLKRRVFAELDALCPPETILATNTTGLPITQIAADTQHPERVIGAHFFNPAPVMKLVEIIRGYATNDATVEKTKAFSTSLGKESIVVEKDYPGFITTRIMNGYLMEALRCFEEGVGSIDDIDRGCKLAFNHPMGPFQFMDLVGIDTLLSVVESFHAGLGERFRPPPVLRQMVAAGRLGRKSGAGFYEYAKREKNS